MSESTNSTGTQAVDRAVAILRLVADGTGRGVRLTDVVQRAGLSKPTAHRLLRALQRHGMISQDQETELYHLGAECFVLGTLASERYGIHRAALPFLARITNSTEDTALLTVRRDWRAICLHREEGTFPIRSHSVGAGDHNPLGVSAGGLAILATLSDAEVEESLKANATEIAKGYPKVTLNLIRKDVAITRDKGYSFNPGRVFPGSWGVGVAVLNARRESEGALSIAAIENRLGERRRQEVAAFLKNEAAHLAEILARPKGASSLRASTGRPVAANSSR